MEWKDYFNLTVFKETVLGPERYFQAELRVPEAFEMNELLLAEFDSLGLSTQEKILFTLPLRKIFIRHKFFKGLEFERIVTNFGQKIARERDPELRFSTTGGGLYLFTSLPKTSPEILKRKRLICFTPEMPLKVMNLTQSPNLELILLLESPSFFRNFPSLWDQSHRIGLSRISEA